MFLIVGSPSDIVVREVYRRLCLKQERVRTVSEAVLYTSVSMSFRRKAKHTRGFLHIDGDQIPLDRVSGVLARPTRTWWPSPEFGLQDQLFVFHETTAAWFCLLSDLACPVVNRFGLGWWLHSPTYPEWLRRRLAAVAKLDAESAQPMTSFSGRLIPVPPGDPADSTSIYAVGGQLIPVGPQGGMALDILGPNRETLTRWQDQSGIPFCRLDLMLNDKLLLKHVEVFPLLDDEDADLVNRVGAAMMELLV
jgi:hypothetical protein